MRAVCALLLVQPAVGVDTCAADTDCKDKLASKCVGTTPNKACQCAADSVPTAPLPAGECPASAHKCVGTAPAKKCGECDTAVADCVAQFTGTTAADYAFSVAGTPDGNKACQNHKCVLNCQKQLLAKCANTPGQGLLGDKATCNSCIVTNMANLQASYCSLAQMQSFCALAPDKAAPGATPVPEHNVCSKSKVVAMWTAWDAYCKTAGPKAAATPHNCDKLVSSVDATDPMKHAVADCEAQTGESCYIFDLDGSRCHGDSATNIFNCRDVPDAQKRSSKPDDQNWLKYCKAPLPKSYAMTDGCSKGYWSGSGTDNQKKSVAGCEKGSWSDPAASTACTADVGDWLDVCTTGHIEYDAVKCTKAKALKCKCAPFDVSGAGCAGTSHRYQTGHSAPSAPAPEHHHHHHHHHGYKHHKSHHYKAWDADEEVRAEGSGTASAYSYLPVACVAVAVLAGVAFVVRRRQTSELPAAQAAGYGTVPP